MEALAYKAFSGKVFTKLIQNRMKQYVERELGKEQAEFRPATGQLLTMRQIP